VHRFVLHGLAPTEHRLHHANPDGAILTIFLADMDLFRADLLDRRRRFRCRRASCLAWYLFVHHCAHHGPDKMPLVLLNITKAIINSQRETTALAQHLGIMSSEPY
jgi:hypothetical protein